jgi:uncharacterized protein YcbK (DUF882 family)
MILRGIWLLLALMPILGASGVRADTRTISLYEIHTKERLAITYKRDGKYVPEAMQKINWLMRDWRQNKATKMAPRLIDVIWELHHELGSREPIHIISGFRSRKTNNSLRKSGGGQAKNSQHVLGNAVDIRFPDVSLKDIRNAALIRENVGVGYYPTSSVPFVHVDVGRVRHWPRMHRHELALLFPDGKSKHIPKGGPLTKHDVQVAIQKLQARDEKYAVASAAGTNTQSARTRIASLSPPSFDVPATANHWNRLWLNKMDGTSILDAGDNSARQWVGQQDTPAGAENIIVERVAAAPEYDHDHPGELYYRPFHITPFLAGESVAGNSAMVALRQPQYDKLYEVLHTGHPQTTSLVSGAGNKDTMLQKFGNNLARNLYTSRL